MKTNTEFPECPHCGSESASRQGPAILPDDTYDPLRSGIYSCRHCREEYQFLAIATEKTFSPTAACPGCGSLRTKITGSPRAHRYHICLDCRKGFRTRRPVEELRPRAGRN